MSISKGPTAQNIKRNLTQL